jgi:hypothetical protein
MKLRFILITLTLSLALIACSDDPGSGPVSEEDFRAACEADCQHDFDCDPQGATPVDQCTAECFADYAEVRGWLRGDVTANLAECFAELSCTADDDLCLAECAPTATHNAYEAQCREVFAACVTEPAELDGICEVTPMPQSSGDVGFFCLFTPEVMQRMLDCIPDGTACQAGITCIQGVMESVGFDG